MTRLAIRCRDLVKHFGDVCAVDGIDLALAPGRFLALLGPSGCGKTTVLRLLAGFERPDAGTIEIGGRLVAGPDVFVPPEQRRVGMVFQDYALFPHLSVAENVAYGIADRSQREARVQKVLALVGLADLGERMPHELSGGQQQRVALARALAPQPEVVLLDEPFSNLDAGRRMHLRAEVRQILREAEATTIFVTHDQEEALSLADEVAVMLDGRLVQTAPPETVYRYPATREVAAFFGENNFLSGEAQDGIVECELGRLPIRGTARGHVEVMLRPEAVSLTLDPEGPGEVVMREFYGHDQLVRVRLPTGTVLRVRLGPDGAFQPGQRVCVAVEGEVMVYPNGRAGP